MSEELQTHLLEEYNRVARAFAVVADIAAVEVGKLIDAWNALPVEVREAIAPVAAAEGEVS